MSEKSKLFFNGKKKVIGMVHLLPLPGNAAYQNNKEEIVKNAIEDAHTLIDCGVDAIMLENFSDWPQYSTEIPASPPASASSARSRSASTSR